MRSFRRDAGHSLRKSADYLNISHTRLWQIENGRLPCDDQIRRISLLYGKSPEVVIKDTQGQLSLDPVATLLNDPGESSRRTERIRARIILEEKDELEGFLLGFRLRKATTGVLG